MKTVKPVSLKQMDQRHKVLLIISIVACSLLLVLGWVSTAGGIFRKDAVDAKQRFKDSFTVIEDAEESIDVKGEVTKIKGYFQERAGVISKAKEAKEAVINNVKEDIENN